MHRTGWTDNDNDAVYIMCAHSANICIYQNARVYMYIVYTYGRKRRVGSALRPEHNDGPALRITNETETAAAAAAR